MKEARGQFHPNLTRENAYIKKVSLKSRTPNKTGKLQLFPKTLSSLQGPDYFAGERRSLAEITAILPALFPIIHRSCLRHPRRLWILLLPPYSSPLERGVVSVPLDRFFAHVELNLHISLLFQSQRLLDRPSSVPLQARRLVRVPSPGLNRCKYLKRAETPANRQSISSCCPSSRCRPLRLHFPFRLEALIHIAVIHMEAHFEYNLTRRPDQYFPESVSAPPQRGVVTFSALRCTTAWQPRHYSQRYLKPSEP